MFLKELKENEKPVFCKLANALACTDGIAQAEIDFFKQYNAEMGTTYTLQENFSEDLEELTEQLKNSSKKSKKIIAFELIGLAHSDFEYSETEMAKVTKICSKFGISTDLQIEMEKTVADLIDIYKKSADLVIKG